MELYQIALIWMAVIIALLYFLKRFKGIDHLKNIAYCRPVLVALGTAAETVAKIWPERKELKIINTIMRAAIEAAETAEKAWKMGNLAKDERNAYAKALVKETLRKIGVEITDKVAAIIDGAIEATCMILPHEKQPEPEVDNDIGD